jgi:hypothetical protein
MNGSKTIALAALAVASLLPAVGVRAESCGPAGCARVGYIFLPDTRLRPADAPASFEIGGRQCAPPEGVQTFDVPGLPPVNEIAMLKADRKPLLTEPEIEGEVDAFQPPHLDPAKGVAGCAAEWHEPDGDTVLQKGAKVRILGYRTFVGHATVMRPVAELVPQAHTDSYPQQLLFALVAVQ